nr:unnamed protein product [Digitaria exilis]
MMIKSRSSSPSPFFEDVAGYLYDRCRYPFNLKLGVESDDRWLHFNDVLKWIGWQRVESDDRWINFSDVLKWRGLLTEDSAAAVDPDICLAYSFSRLLARRYFVFPCPEDGNAQVRDFVLRELLAADKAFTIVEVQLALLHDYFFTNYHSKMKSAVLTVTQGVHSLTAKVILQEVLKEAQELLGRRQVSMEEKKRTIQQLLVRPQEDVSRMKTFEKGMHLGRQLAKQSVSLRWKIIADFWAETILYVAWSSKNNAAHIQHLAQGGEFVTHLWALLCNAGIQSG